MKPIEFADKYFGQYTTKGDEVIPELCPYCKGGSTGKDKRTFALHVIKKTFNCKRGTCPEPSGTYYKLLLDFGELQQTNYRKPKTKPKGLSEGIIQFFKNRGISEDTVKKNKIGKHNNAMVFKYFENGDLVMLKYRTQDKKMWREAGGKPVFYGMDDCDTNKPLIITEGEIDKMVLDECGIDNAVSMPSGTSDLTCIELCWDWLDKFESIVLWTDGDKPGKELEKNLINRLGAWRCKTVDSPYKDANEHLKYEDKDGVVKAVKNAKEVGCEGLLRLADVEGFDPRKVSKIKSSISGINKLIGGHMEGAVSIWTGDSAAGKSTFMQQEALAAIEENEKVFIYSGELQPGVVRYLMNIAAAGEENLKSCVNEQTGHTDYIVPHDIRDKIQKWYRDNLFIYDNNKMETSDNIIKTFKYAYRKHGCRYFILDNLMSIQDIAQNKYEAEDQVVQKVKSLANKLPVHIHIVAHPKKNSGLDKDAIAGFKRITNRVDNIFKIERAEAEKTNASIITVLKSRFYGHAVNQAFIVDFNEKDRRFKMPTEPRKVYGWEEKPTKEWVF